MSDNNKIEENPQPPPGAPVSTPTFVYVLLLLVVILIVVIIVIAMVLRDPSFHCPSKSVKSIYHVRIPTAGQATASGPIVPMVPHAVNAYRNTYVAVPNSFPTQQQQQTIESDNEDVKDQNEPDDPQDENALIIRSVELIDSEKKVIIVGRGFVKDMIVLWDNRIQYTYTRISADILWLDVSHAPLSSIVQTAAQLAPVRSLNVQGLPTCLYDAWTSLSNGRRNTLRIIRPGSDSCLYSQGKQIPYFLTFNAMNAFNEQKETTIHVLVRQSNTGKLLTHTECNSLSVQLHTQKNTKPYTATIQRGIATFIGLEASDMSSLSLLRVGTTSHSVLQTICSYGFYRSS